MSMFRRYRVFGLVIALFSAVVPQVRGDLEAEAELLLARAQAIYSDTPSFEAVAIVRELRFAPTRPGDPDGAPRVMSAAYQRVVLTKGFSDSWRLISQRERDVSGKIMPERTIGFGKTGVGDGEMMVLNAATNSPTRAPIPLAIFRQEVAERLGAFARVDPVFSAVFMNRGNDGPEAFGFERVEIAAREKSGDTSLVRVKATRAGGSSAMLWLDEATSTLVRMIEFNTSGPAAVAPQQIRETLYRYDYTRGAHAVHFDLNDGWNEALPGIADTARFVELPDLLVAAGAGAPSGGGDDTSTEPGFGPSRRNTPGGLVGTNSGQAAGAGAESAAPDVSGQMASIVMVEGDDGVGTGFVARLRGIDFVVTNLHVIGGNERVRVTTVGGKEIPVAGMFGAHGRDIAILRIQGENTVPPLNIAEDPLKTVKLGDQVTVVGNRRGGAVATRVVGTVRGLGPNRVEVDAPFEPGNSGSPILHATTGEVIGVASYSQTRELDELDAGTPSQGRSAPAAPKQKEQRWFGFRMDGVEKWEGIDLVRWRDQARRIEAFEADSEAIYYAMHGRLKEASANPRVRPLIDRFVERYDRMGASPIVAGQEIQEFFHGLRSLASTGVKDLTSGDYYDFFRTSEYWETSIPQQLRARADLVKRLERASENSALFLSRVRR